MPHQISWEAIIAALALGIQIFLQNKSNRQKTDQQHGQNIARFEAMGKQLDDQKHDHETVKDKLDDLKDEVGEVKERVARLEGPGR